MPSFIVSDLLFIIVIKNILINYYVCSKIILFNDFNSVFKVNVYLAYRRNDIESDKKF